MPVVSYGFKHGWDLVTDTRRLASLLGISLGNVKYNTLSPTGLRSPGDVSDGPTTTIILNGRVQFSDSLTLSTCASEAALYPWWVVDSWLYYHTQSPTAYAGILHSKLSNDLLCLLIIAAVLA